MLHTEVVAGETLELLKTLEADTLLSRFALAGGTSLALYLGHRMSVDLDLFTPEPFEANILKAHLEKVYGFRTALIVGNTLQGEINGVKIDCITHAYPNIRPLYMEDGMRLYDMPDLIAMKLAAIADNGTRMKDFIDIACLSVRYSLLEMLEFYTQKFQGVNTISPLKALTYFNDIDFNENVVMLNGDFKWDLIEKRLFDMVTNETKTYRTLPIKIPVKPKVVAEKKPGTGMKRRM
ncbi:MAG: nucleotidyl transferase AbiEii/AbiGii toxin family protein [Bacteroidales bacterium]|nr:nucleotidyl transferase AbiEii/AbiGii toxin family protein [Bacteroidales bacterium]